jgi:DNA-binding LacI/PurR family transcriptional regulator
MAREAVRLLVEQIRSRRAGGEPQAVHKMLKFTLIKRASTAPLESTPGEKRPSRRKGQPAP